MTLISIITLPIFGLYIITDLLLRPAYGSQVITGTTDVGNDVTLQLKTTNPTNVTLWKSGYQEKLGYIIQIENNCMASDIIGSSLGKFAWHCHRQMEFSLILKNVTHKWHDTTWTAITPFLGDAAQTFKLYVRVPVTAVDITPGVSIINVTENTPVNLTCRTSRGRPYADIVWFSDERTPTNDSDDTQISLNTTTDIEIVTDGLGVTTSSLSFYPSKRDNGKRIYCSAITPDFGSVKSTTKPMLNVIYHRKMHFNVRGQRGRARVVVKEGTRIKFICHVDSNPFSMLKILYENQTIMERRPNATRNKPQSLLFGESKCEHSGQYVCESNYIYNNNIVRWTEKRNISLEVLCRPRLFRSIKHTVQALPGTLATIEVKLIANPKLKHTDITWKKFEQHAWVPITSTNNATITTTTTTTQIAGSVLNLTEIRLVFSNVTEEDAGDYMLIAENIVGVFEEVMTLVVVENEFVDESTNTTPSVVDDHSTKEHTMFEKHQANKPIDTGNLPIGQICSAVFGGLSICAGIGLAIYCMKTRTTRKASTRGGVVTARMATTNEHERISNVYQEVENDPGLGLVADSVYSDICRPSVTEHVYADTCISKPSARSIVKDEEATTTIGTEHVYTDITEPLTPVGVIGDPSTTINAAEHVYRDISKPTEPGNHNADGGNSTPPAVPEHVYTCTDVAKHAEPDLANSDNSTTIADVFSDISRSTASVTTGNCNSTIVVPELGNGRTFLIDGYDHDNDNKPKRSASAENNTYDMCEFPGSENTSGDHCIPTTNEHVYSDITIPDATEGDSENVSEPTVIVRVVGGQGRHNGCVYENTKIEWTL